VVTGEYRLGDVRHITASSARITADLGWKADYDLPAGIADLLGRERPLTPTDLSPRPTPP
jgi:dTDP-L-rhamnose 4-epimerase